MTLTWFPSLLSIPLLQLLLLLLLLTIVTIDYPSIAVVLAEAEQAPYSSSSALDDTTTTTTTTTNPIAPVCSLYMAASSNPRGGWGMYTGQNLHKHQILEPRDLAIPLFDAREYRDPSMDAYGLLIEYVTRGGEVDLNREAEEVVALLPGIGSLANGQPGLENVEIGECVTRIPSFNRTHPAVGSSTHVHGVCFHARHKLPAGSELFAVFGDSFYLDRPEQFPNAALSVDYQRADLLLYKFEYIVERNFDSPLASELWSLLQDLLLTLRPNIVQILPTDAPQVGRILA
jgi:hypothetical protein